MEWYVVSLRRRANPQGGVYHSQHGKGLGDTSAWGGGQLLATERVGGAIVGRRPMTGGGAKEVVPRAEQGASAAIM